jgi:hypothetical protein
VKAMTEASSIGAFLRRREFLLTLVGILCFLLLVKAGWSLYQGRNQVLDDEIALKTLQFQKYSRLVARRQEFSELNRALRKFADELKSRYLVLGETPTLTEVQFQTLVQRLARESKVDIRTTKFLTAQKRDGIKILRLRISCRAEISAIKDFLIAVHNSEKLIFLQEVEVKTISRREKRFYYLNAVLTALTI